MGRPLPVKKRLGYIFCLLPILLLAQQPMFFKIDSLNKRAGEHYYGQKDSAYYYYEKVSEIARNLEIDSILVESLFNTTGAASYHFDLKKMGESLNQLDSLISEPHKNNDDNFNILLYYRGDYHLKLFEFSKSRASFERILSNGKTVPKDKKSRTLQSLESASYSFLGKIYMLEGKYNEAKSLYKKNIGDLQSLQPDNLDALNGNYNLLAEVLMKEKKFAEANTYLLKAYDYNRKNNNTNALITNAFHIAENYSHQLKKDSALYFLSSSKSFFRDRPIFYPKYHLRKADIHKNNWEYEVALIEIDSAIQFINKNFANQKSADLETAYNEKGIMYTLLNQEQKAILHFDIALKEALENSEQNLFALKIAKNKLAALQRLENQNAYEKSIVTTDKAITLLNKLKPGFKNDEDKLVLIEDAFPIFESAIEATYNLHIDTNNKDYLKKAFFYFEKSKSVLLLEALLSSKATEFANVPKILLERERQLKSEIGFFERQLQNGSMDKAKLNDEIFRLKQDKRELEEIVEKNYPAYFTLKYNTEVQSLAEMQEQLVDDERLLSYFYGSDYIYVLSVANTELYFERIKVTKTLENDIRKLHKFLSDPTSDRRALSSLSYALYQQLVEPLLGKSQGERIIIAPDGLLNYIPFGSLVTNLQGPVYLIQDRAISYVNSASLWSQLKKKEQAANSLLAFAPGFDSNVASDDTRSGVLGNLPHNTKEVEQVERSFKGQAFFDRNATLQNFTANVSDHSIIHLATHAVFDDQYPEYTYLAFTPKSDSEDILMVKDLYNLSINASLVTLSACESAIGDLKRGEGFLSLARGFFYSGASSIASTLWKVNDNSSSTLMGSFYEHMASGTSKDRALQKAKLSFLEKNRENGLSHPYYWAGYIIQGNTKPLAATTSWWWYILVGSVVLTLFLFRKPLLQLFK